MKVGPFITVSLLVAHVLSVLCSCIEDDNSHCAVPLDASNMLQAGIKVGLSGSSGTSASLVASSSPAQERPQPCGVGNKKLCDNTVQIMYFDEAAIKEWRGKRGIQDFRDLVDTRKAAISGLVGWFTDGEEWNLGGQSNWLEYHPNGVPYSFVKPNGNSMGSVLLTEPCNVISSLEFFDAELGKSPPNELYHVSMNLHAFGAAFYHAASSSGTSVPATFDGLGIQLIFMQFIARIAPGTSLCYAKLDGNGESEVDDTKTCFKFDDAEPLIHEWKAIVEGGDLTQWKGVRDSLAGRAPGYVESALLLVNIFVQRCPAGLAAIIDQQAESIVSESQAKAVAQFTHHPYLAEDLPKCLKVLGVASAFVSALNHQEKVNGMPDYAEGVEPTEPNCEKLPHYTWHKEAAKVITQINDLVSECESGDCREFIENPTPSRYSLVPGKRCGPKNSFLSGTEYTTLAEARHMCDATKGCRGVFDKGCKGTSLYLCTRKKLVKSAIEKGVDDCSHMLGIDIPMDFDFDDDHHER